MSVPILYLKNLTEMEWFPRSLLRVTTLMSNHSPRFCGERCQPRFAIDLLGPKAHIQPYPRHPPVGNATLLR